MWHGFNPWPRKSACCGRGPKTKTKSNQKTNKHSQQRLGLNIINLIKGIHKKPTANILPKGERLEASPDTRNQIWMHFLTISIQHCTQTSCCAVVQWVKNLTAAAQVTVDARVQSQAQHTRLKGPALLQLQLRSQLRLGFSPWPGNFHMS